MISYSTNWMGPIIDNGYPHPAWKIKEHFGVEE
jgi:hypothetical protein